MIKKIKETILYIFRAILIVVLRIVEVILILTLIGFISFLLKM